MRRYGGRLRTRRNSNRALASRVGRVENPALGMEPLEQRHLLAVNTIYAVNAGGPAAVGSDSTAWDVDTAGSPSPFSDQPTSQSSTFGNNKVVNTDAISAEVPTSIFNTERYDAGGVPMQWDFPVAPGNYEVRLYFAEIYNGAHSVGARTFDVLIEGNLVLDNYDTFVEAGPDTAIMESFVVSSDSNLDIDFSPVTQNPAIKGIEILQLADNDTLGSSTSSLDFLSVVVGDSDTQQLTLSHQGGVGDADITIQSTAITGSAAFTDDFNDVTGVVLAPGESTVVSVAFAPTTEGNESATLQINHSGINPPISVSLQGTGIPEQAGESIIRINAGGPAVGAPEWSEDTAANPSSFSNFATAFSNSFTNGSPIDVSDPSIPVGTPASIFSTERSDTPNGEQMQWDIPVVPGTYEVRLYFAEIYGGTASVGARIFDVLIEDSLVLDDYDVFADVGAFAGVMKSFVVNSDSNLDIDFNQVIQNPAIKGIEILQIAEGTSLGSSTSALDFLSVDVGDSDIQQITLTHLGEPGDADITIESTAIIGDSSFTDDFNDATGVVLAPGESTVISVAFAPLAAGAQAATLQINHTGTNPPVTVSLAGNGVAQQTGSSIVRINAGGPAVGDPEWSEDSATNPSPLSNFAAAQSGTFTTTTPINVSHPSIPAGTPASIFSTERSDVTNGDPMQWDIPVIAGPYEVRLYFAEIFGGAAEPQARVFDVLIEDQVVLDDYDVFSDVGAFTGVMKSFVITSDDNLDIDFGAVIENPAIKGIEVVSLQEADTLFVSSDLVDFGSVWTQGPEIETFTVTNAGLPGDPSITITSTSITGSAEFTDNFDDLNGVVLAPGESLNIGVTYAPVDLNTDQAVLQIQHSGSNNPLSVTLNGVGSDTAPIGFGKSTVVGTSTLQHPTSLDWGPDDRLYAAYQNGTIVVYSIERNAANDYTATIEEEITLVRDIPNHDDGGTPNPSITTRLMTGLLLTGTAENPVIYTSSSDPRIGAGPSGEDLNLDTNSIVVSKLSWDGTQWNKVDLVRGLPRSEESHTTNGLLLDEDTNTILITGSGNTNAGAPSNNFAFQTEYAYSAAILSIDLDALEAMPDLVDINGQVYKYDLPTLDDEDRDFDGNGSDEDLANGIQDVFGGNNGKNQAILDPNSPVQIYAPGFRNAYDIVRTENGNLYTIDNGANAGWGDAPILDPETGLATNQVSELGVTIFDNLQLITGPGYYGGHPNPTRANTANTFNESNPQSPVALVGGNPIESIFSVPQANTGAMAVFGASTNGLAEYTASNFGGELQGDLLAASFFGYNSISRLSPDETGAALDLNEILFSNVDLAPLEVIAVGDEGLYPGSIWVTDWATGAIIVFEPNDYEGGSGGPVDPNDLDGDGYSNDDEIANETNPNNAGDVPPDNDGDFLSDLLDDDDDNDSLLDVDDPFAVDPDNGSTTFVGVSYTWAGDTPNSGGLLNLGFTGVMTNGQDNYEDLYDTENLTAGGAAGVLTLDMASEGDALGATNTQEQAFQFGVNVSGEVDPFTVHTRVLAPFAGTTPEDGQSMGVFLGTGDQDNYIKIVVTGNGGGGVTSLSEVGGAVTPGTLDTFSLSGVNFIDLYLSVDPVALTVQPSYTVTQGGGTSAKINLGSTFSVPASWLNGSAAMAVGVISTSAGPGSTFPATWDLIAVESEGSLNNPPTVVAPIGTIDVTEDDPDTLIDLATVFDDIEDGIGLTYTVESNDNPTLVDASIVSSTLTLDYLAGQTGSATVVIRATDSGGLFVEDTISITISPVVSSPLAIESGFAASVSSDAWTTVNLTNIYTSMVVVATPNYDGGSAPLVTRIQNATGSSFEVMIQRADNSTAVTTADVYFFVVEEGVYTVAEHGVAFEAVKYNSTVTDGIGSWNGELQSYSNSYESPVVLGQVMTYNDTGFSTFWSKAAAAGSAPSPTVLYTGKHVGEDPTDRVAETVGYVVFEAGSWSVGGLEFTVGLGANAAEGVTHAPATVYGISGPENPTAAVLSQSGMNGGHGSWALLNGANPFSSTTLSISVDEDQVADNERFHIPEEVAYIVFGGTPGQGFGAAEGAGGGSTNDALSEELLLAAIDDDPTDWISESSELDGSEEGATDVALQELFE